MSRARVIRSEGKGARERARQPRLARVVSQRAWRLEVELQRSRESAAAILSEARREASEQRERLKAEAEAALCARLFALERQAQAERQAWIAHQRAELGHVATVVAERLLHEQLELDPQRVTAIVCDVLRGVEPGQRLTVRVHPADGAALRKRVDELTRVARADHLVVQEDAAIERAGCVVETPLLQLDGRLSTQLAALTSVLDQELKAQAAVGGGAPEDDGEA